MNELIENAEPVIKSFPELKNATDKAMAQAVENFVLIGYLLKKAKDEPELLSGSGYRDYKEFAKYEYGLEESQVSRFISINERYGDGAQLLPQYRGFGQSKLAEMLTLPAAVAEELPTEITRQEIRELKKEIAEENKITPMEVAIEQANHPDVNVIEEFWKDWITKNPERFVKIEPDNEYETFFRGCVLNARVPGVGKLMMTEKEEKITITNLRTGEKETYNLREIQEVFEDTTPNFYTEESWEEITGQKFPKIAPAQDKENKPKSEEKEAEITENKASEEPETVADKENKPILEKIEPKAEDILPPVEEPTEEASMAAEPKEESEQVSNTQNQEAAEQEEENEPSAMELFGYVRNNVNRLEGFLNAGSDAEAKRIIDTITEDLQEIRNRL